MKPTSRTLSWAFVIIMLAVGIFTAAGVILMHKQPLVLQGQTEATEIRIRALDQNDNIVNFYQIGRAHV